MAELEAQIAKEAEELKKAPVVKTFGAIVGRCHMCGQICDLNDLEPFDEHIKGFPASARMAGPCCHPRRHIRG